jgi:predicted AlkP superfamily phosphohydrolase/phosphomutase
MNSTTINMTAEKRDRLIEIYNKVSDVLNDEIKKMSSESAERIVFCHMIIETMYHNDKEALQRMGIIIDNNKLYNTKLGD